MTLKERIRIINKFEQSEGYPKNSLLRPMLFETVGTLSPSIVNKLSGAVGLIQFLPATLSRLGLSTGVVAAMDIHKQLKVVKSYLKPYKSKLLKTNDPLDFYLAILYPVLIGKPDNAIMAIKGAKTYLQNRGLDIDKDGDIEKGDIRITFNKAVNRIAKRNGIVLGSVLPLVLLLITGIVFIYFYK